MATKKQIDANRKNATHSTGPITDYGRATSCRNSLKHGLASSQLVIQGECEEDFNTMVAALIAEHKPATTTETLLVHDMAKYHWLADRALRMQGYAIERNAGRAPDNLAVLVRYQTANERGFHRAFTALTLLRKTRLAEIGFASQQAATPPPPPHPTHSVLAAKFAKASANTAEPLNMTASKPPGGHSESAVK